MRIVSLVTFTTLLISSVAFSANAEETCRGTTGTISPVSVQCTGGCTDIHSTCSLNVGTGDWAQYKICSCGKNPNGCCGLGEKKDGNGDYQLVTVGDCIGCGSPTSACQKTTVDGQTSPICVAPPP
jgi:hypothetical protein